MDVINSYLPDYEELNESLGEDLEYLLQRMLRNSPTTSQKILQLLLRLSMSNGGPLPKRKPPPPPLQRRQARLDSTLESPSECLESSLPPPWSPPATKRRSRLTRRPSSERKRYLIESIITHEVF